MTEIRHLRSGINQSGVRAHNERLILTMLQRSGALAGRDLARQADLSPQTVSVILRKLESDALVKRGAPQRGKVGKPSVPMTLNPDGLLSVGLKIGRRSADLLLMDFLGTVRAQSRLTYPFPMPDTVLNFLDTELKRVFGDLGDDLRQRVCGIGIAMPFELWNWHDLVGAPPKEFAAWRDIDFGAEVRKRANLPVHLVNDATAACQAELYFGRGKMYRNFAYFFLGAFVGGGVVMNHSVLEGQYGNTGAFGSLPAMLPDGRTGQLIDVASIRNLEERLSVDGLDTRALWDMPQNWGPLERHVGPWIDQTARALASASLSVCGVIDFEAVIIDGAMPEEIRQRLVDRTRAALADLDARGLVVPKIEAGQIGGNARAIGAACGPIISEFLLGEFAGPFAASVGM